MNKLKNIFILILVAIIPFANIDAKGKQKKKSGTQKSTVKKKASPAKKKTVVKKGKASTAKKVVATPKKTTTKTVAVAPKKEVKEEEATTVKTRDTTKPDVVVLYSSFKPTLRNAAKINFTAATPILDTTRIALTYKVPAQNLFFSYQPVPIKPLALFVDSSIRWQNIQYVKVGFGNYSTPYLEAGAAFGNGVKALTSVHAKYTSSKSSRAFQQASKLGIEALGNYSAGNLEWNGKVFYSGNTQYQYGYEQSTLVFTKDSLRQRFNTIGLNIGVRNKQANSYGITYKPSLGVNYFFDSKDGKETNFIVKLPVNKSFGTMIAFDLALTADITSYKTKTQSIKNNLFYLEPTLQFKTPNLKVNFGIIPAWDNQNNTILPNISAEAKINGEKFVLQAGWIGYYQKNTYQSLSAINPWLQQPTSLINTKIREQYAGFKGSAGSHFTYNAKLAFMQLGGQPLFVNDVVDGKSFLILSEPDLQAIKIHGEVGYTVQEKFSLLAAVTVNQFTKLSVYDKAFGLSPLELTGSARWKVLQDLHVKSDIFFWDGPRYLSKTLQTQKLDAAVDLNLGLEYSLMPKLNLWLQFNNLLNNRYQRWSQYEVLGLNVVGGVVYSFK